MHLLVLSAFRPDLFVVADTYFAVSQCTFWCSVLSDGNIIVYDDGTILFVSMHLLVLSAFRRGGPQTTPSHTAGVSMHLLVLSAFRHSAMRAIGRLSRSLNAPSGAQCFPTMMIAYAARLTRGLNAPSGAQYFPTEIVASDIMEDVSQCTFWCSVLSDAGVTRQTIYRWIGSQCTFWCSVLSDSSSAKTGRSPTFRSQCTFWCSVLSDEAKPVISAQPTMSQCTFWCSVLSDEMGGAVRQTPDVLVSMHLLVLSAFRLSNRTSRT